MTDAEPATIDRYVFAGAEYDTLEEAQAARSNAEKQRAADYQEALNHAREDHERQLEQLRDLGVEPGELPPFVAPAVLPLPDIDTRSYHLVHDVISDRDGEPVVLGVSAEDAQHEAARLTEEQRDRRVAEPVHAFVPDHRELGPIDAPPAGDVAMIPSEPTATTTYSVTDRLVLVDLAAEEA